MCVTHHVYICITQSYVFHVHAKADFTRSYNKRMHTKLYTYIYAYTMIHIYMRRLSCVPANTSAQASRFNFKISVRSDKDFKVCANSVCVYAYVTILIWILTYELSGYVLSVWACKHMYTWLMACMHMQGYKFTNTYACMYIYVCG